MQTQGFSDGFQRTFPDRDSAEAAWSAYVRYKAYPDYGIGPWVVFIGRKPGVAIKVWVLTPRVAARRFNFWRNSQARNSSALSKATHLRSFGLVLQFRTELSNSRSSLNGSLKCSPIPTYFPAWTLWSLSQRGIVRYTKQYQLSHLPLQSWCLRIALESWPNPKLQSCRIRRWNVMHQVLHSSRLCRGTRPLSLATGGMLHTMQFSLVYVTACEHISPFARMTSP